MTQVTDYAGNVYSYTYDALSRIDTVKKDGEVIASYSYTPFGTIDTVTYPEGSSSYTYDNAMQILSVENTLPDNSIANRFEYQYDIAGNQGLKTVY